VTDHHAEQRTHKGVAEVIAWSVKHMDPQTTYLVRLFPLLAMVSGMVPVTSDAFDCQQPISSYQKLVCETPELRDKARQAQELYSALKQRLWTTELRKLQTERQAADLYRDEFYSKWMKTVSREQAIADVVKELDSGVTTLRAKTAGRPMAAPAELAVRAKICRSDRFCNLALKTEVGRDTLGHRVFIVVNDETPVNRVSTDSGCWRTEWWRVTYDGQGIRKADLIVTEREDRADPDNYCNYGNYGGNEQVSIKNGVLEYLQEGGEWSTTTTWQLSPDYIKTQESTSVWSRMTPNFGRITTSDLQLGITRESLTYAICAKKDDVYEESTAEYDQIPVLDSGKHPQFDWRRSDWPARLRVQADGKHEKDTAGFVLTKTSARRYADGDVASIVVAVVDNDQLLIEVDDADVIIGSKSWVSDSHVELWLWPRGADAAQPCLVPTWSKSLMQRVPPDDLRAADQATKDAPSEGPIKPGPLYQWGIRTADGKLFGGFGSPGPEMLTVETSKLDGRRTRFLVRLPASGPLTVLYSARSAEGKQHLFGTSKLRYGDPTSLGAISYDQEVMKRRSQEAVVERAALAVLLPTFFSAIERGDINTLRQNLANDPKLANAVAADGFTALMAAVGNGQIDAVTVLLGAGARVNAITAEGFSAMHYAVGAKTPAKFVLSPSGSSSLMHYTDLVQLPSDKRLAVATQLLAKHAEVNVRNMEGNTPLLLAASEADGSPLDLVKLLISYKADTTVTDPDGNNILHRSLAAEPPNAPLVQYLLANYPKLQRPTDYGVTPVMLAAGNADVAVLRAALERGTANINARNTSGSTALHYAVSAGRVDNVKLLLVRGSDPTIANKDGDTPLRQAQAQRFEEIVTILQSVK
jgi:ankyrin repeat protein